MPKDQVFHYTVCELIEALSSFPPDIPVLTSGYENGFENIQKPETINLFHKADAPYYDGKFQPAGEGSSASIQAVVLARVKRETS